MRSRARSRGSRPPKLNQQITMTVVHLLVIDTAQMLHDYLELLSLSVRTLLERGSGGRSSKAGAPDILNPCHAARPWQALDCGGAVLCKYLKSLANQYESVSRLSRPAK